jgi:3-deoxy-D-manno-octulosonic-acid transferase
MDAISMTSQRQAQRMISLGAPEHKIRICKNAKYGNLIHRTRQGVYLVNDFRNLLSLNAETPVFLAGSLRTGEVPAVIETCISLKRSCPDLVCIMAPRHLSRVGHLEKSLQQNNVAFHLWSRLKYGGEQRVHPVILVDTLGDLFYLYALASVVFCGASLVDLGGQNVLEPAAWSKVPLYGPHMDDFEDAVELLESNRAGIRVTNSNELIKKTLWLIHDSKAREQWGQRAFEVVLSHVGAGQETARVILDLLEAP